jgi:hypothetical protein
MQDCPTIIANYLQLALALKTEIQTGCMGDRLAVLATAMGIPATAELRRFLDWKLPIHKCRNSIDRPLNPP